MSQVIKITYNDTTEIDYLYDENENVTSVTDNTGTTTFTYNGLNEVTQKVLPSGVTFNFTYDTIGNLTEMTEQTCGTCTVAEDVYYDFNEVNLVKDMGTKDSGGTKHQLATFSYDKNHRRTVTTYANGVTMTNSYDNAGHETGVVAKKGTTTLTSYTYSYTNPATSQATSLRYSMTDTANDTTKYTYDALNRLTDALTKNSGGTTLAEYQYAYDGANNRTSTTNPSGTTTYSYNDANELTGINSGATTYTFDADGNETGNSAGLALAYNDRNQTTSITPVGGSAVSYTYSGADQNNRVQVNSAVADYTQQGQYDDGTAIFLRDPQGTLVAEVTGGNTYDYLLDGLGSVVGLADSSGTLIASYQYDPYGNPTSTMGTTYNPYRFASGYYDSNTGYYKFGIRYEDSKLGRWTQQDPIQGHLSDPSTLNRYVYASCNPGNLVDPTGATPSQLLITIGVQTFVAAACTFGAFVATGTIVGIPAATVLGACAVTFGLTAATLGLVALSQS